MRNIPIHRPQNVRYERQGSFSYNCQGCCRCCYHKIIHLNPYEVARLARNRGISTTEFLSRYTAANGTALKQQENGACVFLTTRGCDVHSDRPLVCRLYPLGRRTTAEGGEWFSEISPHPETEGEYGTNGTVEEFLIRQGAQPLIEAVDRYVDLVGRMSQVLQTKTAHHAKLEHEVQDMVEGIVRGENHEIPDVLDMDQTVERFCSDRGIPIPLDINEKSNLHVQAIEEWLHKV